MQMYFKYHVSSPWGMHIPFWRQYPCLSNRPDGFRTKWSHHPPRTIAFPLLSASTRHPLSLMPPYLFSPVWGKLGDWPLTYLYTFQDGVPGCEMYTSRPHVPLLLVKTSCPQACSFSRSPVFPVSWACCTIGNDHPQNQEKVLCAESGLSPQCAEGGIGRGSGCSCSG